MAANLCVYAIITEQIVKIKVIASQIENILPFWSFVEVKKKTVYDFFFIDKPSKCQKLGFLRWDIICNSLFSDKSFECQKTVLSERGIFQISFLYFFPNTV